MWHRKERKERRKIIPNIVDTSFRSKDQGQRMHSACTNFCWRWWGSSLPGSAHAWPSAQAILSTFRFFKKIKLTPYDNPWQLWPNILNIKDIKMMKTFYTVIFASFHVYTVHHSDLTFYMLKIDYETIKIRRPKISKDKFRSNWFKDERWEMRNKTNCNSNIFIQFSVFHQLPNSHWI